MKFTAALLLTAAFALPAAAQPVTFATTSGRVTTQHNDGLVAFGVRKVPNLR